MNIFIFLFLLSLVLNLFRVAIMRNSMKPDVPKRLLQMKAQIEKGKPHRSLWSALRAEPMFDDHYRRVPGRLSCTVMPLQVNKENVWQLRVGFRTTADSRPSHFISVPVYSNGKIYDV